MADVPILHTERLTLRGHMLSDFDDMVALFSDPLALRFVGRGKPQDAQATWYRLLRHAGLWSLVGYGSWVFTDRETGAYVGSGGLLESKRGIAELEGVPEVGWAVRSDLAGQGLATEGIRAALAWADVHVDAPATRCIIDPENIASIRVARKCGFREVMQVKDGDTALILLERPRGG